MNLMDEFRMLKIPNKVKGLKGKNNYRIVQLNTMPLAVSYSNPGKSRSKRKQVLLLDLREIRRGQATSAFELYGKDPLLETRSFSIIYFDGRKYGSLNFGLFPLIPVAESQDVAEQWITGLYSMLPSTEFVQHSVIPSISLSSWLKNIWNSIDVKLEDKLNLDQVVQVFKRLNILLSLREIKSAFKVIFNSITLFLQNASLSKNSTIDFRSFERLYRTLRLRRDVAEIFLEFRSGSTLSFDDFWRFLVDVQNVTWTRDQAMASFEKFTFSNENGMDLDHFSAL